MPIDATLVDEAGAIAIGSIFKSFGSETLHDDGWIRAISRIGLHAERLDFAANVSPTWINFRPDVTA